jgi:hypothetical protein
MIHQVLLQVMEVVVAVDLVLVKVLPVTVVYREPEQRVKVIMVLVVE